MRDHEWASGRAEQMGRPGRWTLPVQSPADEARDVKSRIPREWLLGIGVAAGAVLAGCTAAPQPYPGMMGSEAGAGPGPGYHYSAPVCAAPATLPGQVVTVVLADMGMTSMMGGTAPLGAPMMLRATPASVTAGTVSLVAQNMGWRTHELVILPLAAGASAGQRTPGSDGKVEESGSLGEASANCAAGSAEGIAGASAGWTTVTLPAGRYELVCNLANHYADGMHQELDVVSG